MPRRSLQFYLAFDLDAPTTSVGICNTGISSSIAFAIWSLSIRAVSTSTWWVNSKVELRSYIYMKSPSVDLGGCDPMITLAEWQTLMNLCSNSLLFDLTVIICASICWGFSLLFSIFPTSIKIKLCMNYDRCWN